MLVSAHDQTQLAHVYKAVFIQCGCDMGEAGSKSSSVRDVIDQYPIKLRVEQQMALFSHNVFHAKRTLTWSDIVHPSNPGITFRACVNAGVEISKLYNMQRELEEWISHGKVCVEDCRDLAPWSPNPFFHFGCHIGDLVVKRSVLTHAVLKRGGVTFEVLWERYGLTPELMGLVKFTPEQWIELGLEERHLAYFSSDKQWQEVFGNLRRQDVSLGISRG